jgi:hypothetical protein
MNTIPRNLDDFDASEWGNVQLPGLSDEELHAKNWNQVTLNIETWKNENTRNARIKGIKKAKAEVSKFTQYSRKELRKIYDESWVEFRGQPLVDSLSKKYNLSSIAVQNLIYNYSNIVSENIHNKNVKKWEQEYGFGIWQITTPGIELLGDYDTFATIKIPCSAIWHIRYNMIDATPKEIRDYLLPWTNGKYITNNSGGIENGRYTTFRKKLYSEFLTNQHCNTFIIDCKYKMQTWLQKMLDRKISLIYQHQILSSPIKLKGPLAGYKIEKISC